jgi:pilus assembly protein CpaF
MTSQEIFEQFLQPLKPHFSHPEVNEIRINPNGSIYEERAGGIHLVPVTVAAQAIEFAVKSVAGWKNQPLNEKYPRLDVRLDDGTRLAILAPPIVRPGYALTIRRFPVAYSLTDLIQQGSLTPEQALYLVALIREKKTLLISGHPGSGKTTLARVLLNQIPIEERLILIEDPAELNLYASDFRDILELEVRTGTSSTPAFTATDALQAALRHSPCRIIVGELRGGEAATFLEALNTGRPGSLTTLHANSAEDALDRLVTLVRRGDPHVPRDVIVDTISRAVDAVVHMDVRDGKRMVTELAEVAGVNENHTRILTSPMFAEKEAYAH